MYFELFRNYSLGLCRRLGCGIFIELRSYQWFSRKFESFNENSIGNFCCYLIEFPLKSFSLEINSPLPLTINIPAEVGIL